MAFKVVVKEVNVENVVKGKSRYSKAVVTYDYQGQTRSQNIMSFANPDVFKTIQDVKPGQTIAIDTTKNAAGFNEWAKVEVVAEDTGGNTDAPTGAKAPTGGKVTGSNYETKEERAAKQVLIVRQSCLAQALVYHANEELSTDDVLKTADIFVDWVFQKDTPSLTDMPDDDLGDVPH